MIKKLLIIFLFSICHYNFAAGPFSHVFLADLYLQMVHGELVNVEDFKTLKQQYLMGALLPDIRYMGVIKRDQTHHSDNDYYSMSIKEGLMGGVHHHSFIDQHRERFATVYGIYKKLDFIDQNDQAIFLKLVEDEIYFRKSNAEYNISTEVYPKDMQDFNISRDEINKWYEIVNNYLALGPLKFIKLISKKGQKYFQIGPDKLMEWAEKLESCVNDKEFDIYCNKLISSFKEHYSFIASDKGNLFDHAKFNRWLKTFANKAVTLGIDRKLVDKELKSVFFNPRVLYKDRNQNKIASFTKDSIAKWLQMPEYGDNITRGTIGKSMLTKYAEVLSEIEKKYGVNKEVVVAIWGLESKYGYSNCMFEALDATLTLAYDGRRKFFKREAITILQEIAKGKIVRPQPSSWAGAIGQVKFLPSNITRYSSSYTNNKNVDLMDSIPDILSSIAFYLSKHGYKKDLAPGQLVFVNSSFNLQDYNITTLQNIKQHLTPELGKWLIDYDQNVRLIKIEDNKFADIIVTDNYKVLMKWNRSDLFGAKIIYLLNEFY